LSQAPPRPRPAARHALPRFLAVGLAGVAVNELTLFLLHGLGGVPLLVAVALATETAILSNYAGNELLTFHLRRLHLGRLVRFNAVALGGLALTVASMWLLQRVAPLHYLVANLIAIAVGSIWNFAANFGWTWGPRTMPPSSMEE
jgi:dolichol-phosphate mannosyltransferase